MKYIFDETRIIIEIVLTLKFTLAPFVSVTSS
jgi:hypothetical protein